jgi:hypothetical protein
VEHSCGTAVLDGLLDGCGAGGVWDDTMTQAAADDDVFFRLAYVFLYDFCGFDGISCNHTE